MSACIAVIDIGSNTIKLSVLSGRLTFKLLHHSVARVRLSAGMTQNDDLIDLGILEEAAESILKLKEEAESYEPRVIIAVATSALRQAVNQSICLERIEALSGLKVRVLSGFEEASLLGRGAGTDPLLSDLSGDLTMLDIGGGSIELVHMKNRDVEQAVSLPLGAVKMTEQFIRDSQQVISYDESESIFEHLLEAIKESDFDFTDIPLPIIGTGGAFVALRSIFAARDGLSLKASPSMMSCSEIGDLLTKLCMMSNEERIEIAGMPAQRADILPAALVTILSVAEMSGSTHFIHSFHNLPYGVAAEAMGS